MIVGTKKNRHSSIEIYFDLSPNRQEILYYQALKDHIWPSGNYDSTQILSIKTIYFAIGIGRSLS